MPPLAALAPIIAAGAGATASIIGASKQASAATKGAQIQTDAATKAAEIQAKSQADALAFQKQQAAIDLQNQEATRHANYDQWAAEQGRKNTLGGLLGLPTAQIPGYVPLTTTPTTGQPTSTAPTTGAAPLVGGDAEARFNSVFPGDTLSSAQLAGGRDALSKVGLEPVSNASGIFGKVKDTKTGVIYDVIQSAGAGGTKKQWLAPSSGASAASAAPTPNAMSLMGMLQPSTPALQAPAPTMTAPLWQPQRRSLLGMMG